MKIETAEDVINSLADYEVEALLELVSYTSAEAMRGYLKGIQSARKWIRQHEKPFDWKP